MLRARHMHRTGEHARLTGPVARQPCNPCFDRCSSCRKCHGGSSSQGRTSFRSHEARNGPSGAEGKRAWPRWQAQDGPVGRRPGHRSRSRYPPPSAYLLTGDRGDSARNSHRVRSPEEGPTGFCGDKGEETPAAVRFDCMTQVNRLGIRHHRLWPLAARRAGVQRPRHFPPGAGELGGLINK